MTTRARAVTGVYAMLSESSDGASWPLLASVLSGDPTDPLLTPNGPLRTLGMLLSLHVHRSACTIKLLKLGYVMRLRVAVQSFFKKKK